MKIESPRSFENIAKALGRSVLTIQNDYDSAMRKIRYYLLKNKEIRNDLYEYLDYIDNFKAKSETRDTITKDSE